jgi:hypothetical protein
MILSMTVHEAVQKAAQILAEEQVAPTLGYRYVSAQWPAGIWHGRQSEGWTPALAGHHALEAERKYRPRQVHEDPRLYVFESTNFTLLLTIFSQLDEADRQSFISRLLELVRKPLPALPLKHGTRFPSFSCQTSALALLAEFCVRTGYLKELLAATAASDMPAASLAIMLNEIEEIIALNFNLFSDSELESIPSGLLHLRNIAERQAWASRRKRGTPVELAEKNPDYCPGFEAIGTEIVAAIDAIKEECRKARYWYLKGALQELPNLEIERDKLKVESYLVKLGFGPDMVKALNAAESIYKSAASPFELKNCLGHLRSFLEHLHRQSAMAIATVAGETVSDTWGVATLYLRQREYFTKEHERFVASLYTLLSDESVHPLTADREYARLLRNVVIEYGVMLLTALDKRGVKM